MNPLKRFASPIFSLFYVLAVISRSSAHAASASQASKETIRPPLVKAWEFDSKEQCDSILPIGHDRIAFGTSHSYGMIDARTGKSLWVKSFTNPATGTSLESDGKSLYVLIGKGKLLACDPRTGATRWSFPLHDDTSVPILDHGTMYVSLQAGEFSAIDLQTHQIRWKQSLFPPTVSPQSEAQEHSVVVALEVRNGVVMAGQGNSAVGIDTATGALLWRHTIPPNPHNTYGNPVNSLCSDGKRGYCLRFNGEVEAFELRTGRLLWKRTEPYFDDEYLWSCRIDNALITAARDGFVRALESRSGRLLWFRELERVTTFRSASLSEPLLTEGGNALIVDSRNVWKIALGTGEIRWSWNLDQDQLRPLWCGQIGNRLVIMTSDGLICFRPGKSTPLPTDHATRLVLAKRLADQFVALLQGKSSDPAQTRNTKRALLKLDSEAFEALFPYLSSAAVGVAAKPANNSLFFDLLETIAEVMRPTNAAQTQAILQILHQLPPHASSDARSKLIERLTDHGNESLILPILREKAAAVLAERDRPEGHLPTFRTLMALDKLPATVPTEKSFAPTTLLATGSDAQGVTWGLITSPIIGSMGDLWVVPRTTEGRWGDPIFTGLDTAAEQAVRRARDRKPFLYKGRTLAQWIKDGDWVAEFARNPNLTRDTDGDGWTDLVETRLGTDPNRADTDGDGIHDSESHCPLSGRRAPQGDAEEILAAAFDARTRFPESGPEPFCVTFPRGTIPFRLTGHGGIVLGVTPDSQALTNLERLFGEGMGFVRFCVSSNAISRPEHLRRQQSGRINDLIVWNAAHTVATVGISLYYGGLSGEVYEIHLRKIDGRWIVIGSRQTSVS